MKKVKSIYLEGVESIYGVDNAVRVTPVLPNDIVLSVKIAFSEFIVNLAHQDEYNPATLFSLWKLKTLDELKDYFYNCAFIIFWLEEEE